MIEAGRVKVNGQTVTAMGVKISPRQDKVTVDGQPVTVPQTPPIYIILNKPPQVLSTTADDRGRRTVLDFVETDSRLFPVGRLDFHSEGLILLTNDGQLAQKLTHPSFAHEREYQVLLNRTPARDDLRRWRAGGFRVDGRAVGRMRVDLLPALGEGWVRVVLVEGRKRQIREVAGQLNLSVITLLRVRLGPIKLGNLKTGAWRYLNSREVTQLKGEIASKRKRKPPKI